MKIIPATINGPLSRVIGSLDVLGNGTNHTLPHVNPFVLLDEACTITKPNIPAFGLHPHSGAMILTICLSGYVENVSFDCKSSKVQSVHGPGPFVLAVNAGRGVVHDEHTYDYDDAEGKCSTKLIQLAWMTGDDVLDSEMFYDAHPIVLEQEDGVQVMLCAGNYGPKSSVISCREVPSVTVLIITLPPGGKFETDEFVDRMGNGFVYNLGYEGRKGPVWVNGKEVLESKVAVELDFHSRNVEIENRGSDCEATTLLGFARPLDKVWTKLLMHNGFIFAKSQEAAFEKKLEFEKVGAANFGRSLN